MSELKPFEIPCPKCGNPDVSRSFWARNVIRPAMTWGKVEGKYESVNGDKRWATRDHIVNHCRCCKHDWKTLPMKTERISSKVANRAVSEAEVVRGGE